MHECTHTLCEYSCMYMHVCMYVMYIPRRYAYSMHTLPHNLFLIYAYGTYYYIIYILHIFGKMKKIMSVTTSPLTHPRMYSLHYPDHQFQL